MIRRISGLLLLTMMAAVHSPLFPQRFGEYLGDESILYAQTKQVNQFFRRFNGEEGLAGVRYYPGDSLYQKPSFRRKYLAALFDLDNHQISEATRRSFIDQVTNERSPALLDFESPGWFAEVTTRFIYYGQEENVTLFLKLEQENLGYKWVLHNVFFRPFNSLFDAPDNGNPLFLHPMSHELDFMNLIKVFRDKENIAQYANKDYKPDYLTILLYEIKRGNMRFVTVQNVKFHFFQIPGWYFELSDHRRSGMNAGWLISAITPITEQEREILLRYIYHE